MDQRKEKAERAKELRDDIETLTKADLHNGFLAWKNFSTHEELVPAGMLKQVLAAGRTVLLQQWTDELQELLGENIEPLEVTAFTDSEAEIGNIKFDRGPTGCLCVSIPTNVDHCLIKPQYVPLIADWLQRFLKQVDP